MKEFLGKLAFIILWPATWFYAPLRVRSRVIIRVDDEILAVKGLFGFGDWVTPGGGLKFAEKPLDGAIREIYEETSVELDSSQLTQLTDEPIITKNYGLMLRLIYFVVDLRHKPEIKLSHEHIDYDWVKVDELKLPQEILSIINRGK